MRAPCDRLDHEGINVSPGCGGRPRDVGCRDPRGGVERARIEHESDTEEHFPPSHPQRDWAFSDGDSDSIALVLGGGPIECVYWATRESAIQNGLGHIQVAPGL